MIPPGPLAFRIYQHLLAYLNNEAGLRPVLEAVYDAEEASLRGSDPALDDLIGRILLRWAERTEYPGYETSEEDFRAELSNLIQTVWMGKRSAIELGTSARTIEARLTL